MTGLTDHLSALPIELQLYIFSFLKERDLAVMETVSKIFQIPSNDDSLWMPIAKKWEASLVENLPTKKGVKLTTLKIKKINSCILQLCPKIPYHSNLAEQCKAIHTYLNISQDKKHTDSIELMACKMIENGLLDSFKELYRLGLVKPCIFALGKAIDKKHIEMVKFIMKNEGKTLEGETAALEKKWREGYSRNVYLEKYKPLVNMRNGIVQKAKVLISEKEMLDYVEKRIQPTTCCILS
jgi:hypothetical protein